MKAENRALEYAKGIAVWIGAVAIAIVSTALMLGLLGASAWLVWWVVDALKG